MTQAQTNVDLSDVQVKLWVSAQTCRLVTPVCCCGSVDYRANIRVALTNLQNTISIVLLLFINVDRGSGLSLMKETALGPSVCQ